MLPTLFNSLYINCLQGKCRYVGKNRKLFGMRLFVVPKMVSTNCGKQVVSSTVISKLGKIDIFAFEGKFGEI